MTRESKKLSFGLSLLVVCAILVSVTPVLAVEWEGPKPDFEASPTSGYAPLTVEFADKTNWEGPLPGSFIGFLTEPIEQRGKDSCRWIGTWDFGDGTTATAPYDEGSSFHRSHVYTAPGTYTVSLTWVYECQEVKFTSFLRDVSSGAKRQQIRFEDPFVETKHLYIEVLAPPEEKKTKRPPEPANLSLSNLVVSPTEVLPTQEVVITATVCNSGELTGTMSVDLFINGVAEQSQTVGVSGGSCQSVTFNVARTPPGTYEVAVDGMPGQFSVIAPTNVPEIKVQNVPPQETGGIGTAGIIAIVAVLIVLVAAIFVILRRP